MDWLKRLAQRIQGALEQLGRIQTAYRSGERRGRAVGASLRGKKRR